MSACLHQAGVGASPEIRTLTPLRTLVPKTSAYTVPPEKHVLVEARRIELRFFGCKPTV